MSLIRTAPRPFRPQNQSFLTTDRFVIWLGVLVLLVLVTIPVIMLLFTSLRGPLGYLPFEAGTEFTNINYAMALEAPAFWRMLRDTAFYTAGSVGLAFLFAFIMAWVIERTNVPFRAILFAGVLIPFLFSPGAMVGRWSRLFWPRTGSANVFLRDFLPPMEQGPVDPFSMYGMVLAQALLLTPIMFLLLTAVLRNMSGTLEEASRTAGASSYQTLRRVTFPLMLPGVFTAAVLGAWFTLDSTTVPAALSGFSRTRLLSVRVFFSSNTADGLPLYGVAAAYAVLIMIMLYALFVFYAHLTRHADRYATVLGKADRAPRFRLGLWGAPALVVMVFYFVAMWGAPVYSLVRGSILGGLSAYQFVLTSSRFWEAVWNTLIVAGGSATLGTAVVIIVAWVVVRSRPTGFIRALDGMATLPLVIPALLGGVAFLLFYLSADGLHLYGTLLGLLFAYTYRLAIPYRVSNAGMRQIGIEMEEASATSGADRFTTLRQIVIPLLAPSVAISWTIFFIFNLRETTLLRMLGSNTTTLTTLGFRGPPGASAAATVLSILFIVSILLFVRFWLLRRARLL